MNHARVLVLNQSFEPINVCNARRAIRMMMLGKADTVESDGILVRSETLEFPLPVVIRLKRYVYVPRRGEIPFSKKNVCRRDGYTCQYCGHQGGQLTVDHVVPRSRGGLSTWENVVCSCRACNARKGDRLPAEIGMKLLSKPRRPGFFHPLGLSARVLDAVQHHWNKYLHPGQAL